MEKVVKQHKVRKGTYEEILHSVLDEYYENNSEFNSSFIEFCSPELTGRQILELYQELMDVINEDSVLFVSDLTLAEKSDEIISFCAIDNDFVELPDYAGTLTICDYLHSIEQIDDFRLVRFMSDDETRKNLLLDLIW